MLAQWANHWCSRDVDAGAAAGVTDGEMVEGWREGTLTSHCFGGVLDVVVRAGEICKIANGDGEVHVDCRDRLDGVWGETFCQVVVGGFLDFGLDELADLEMDLGVERCEGVEGGLLENVFGEARDGGEDVVEELEENDLVLVASDCARLAFFANGGDSKGNVVDAEMVFIPGTWSGHDSCLKDWYPNSFSRTVFVFSCLRVFVFSCRGGDRR